MLHVIILLLYINRKTRKQIAVKSISAAGVWQRFLPGHQLKLTAHEKIQADIFSLFVNPDEWLRA